MSARRWFNASFVAACAFPALAWAHPGHGDGGGSNTLLHYVLEPAHVVVGFGALAIIVTGFVAMKRGRQQQR